MKRPTAIISILIGFFCLYLEFRSIKPNLFLEEIGEYLLLFVFVVLAIITATKDSMNERHERWLSKYKMSITCFVLLTTILVHKFLQSDLLYGTTDFTAYNDSISHGVTLDFKTNDNLKITVTEHFGETNYYGTYERKGDYIYFDIDTDLVLLKLL